MVQFKGKVDASYLDALKGAVQRDKDHTYELLALQPGASVLDVGCGPATDTLALAALVGSAGRVVGVDFDPEMVTTANARAEEAGLASLVTHQVGDATALPFSDHTFDACRSERVFQHLPDPAGALAEMIRVTRPGGRIVVLDTDHGSRMVDTPEHDVWYRLTRYLCDHMITSPWAARQLYRLFLDAELQDVTVEPRAVGYHDFDLVRTAAQLDQLDARALEAGVVTADEVARLRSSLEEAAAHGTFFAVWLMILAAGTKPGA